MQLTPFQSVPSNSVCVLQELILVIPGAMHVDNTIRVQTIKREDNPLYYEAIEAFEGITGTPVVTNTSFNRKVEPIVNTPDEALAMFGATEMDALAIGPYLQVTKKFSEKQ
jgi:carbamoyltransferase